MNVAFTYCLGLYRRSLVVRVLWCLSFFLPLSIQAQEIENPFNLRSWSDIAEGKILYDVFCLRCHSAEGTGGEGPSLIDDIWLYGSSDADIFKTVTQGYAQNGMQAFGGVLTETEIWQVITYIQSTARGRADDTGETDDNAAAVSSEAQLVRNAEEEEIIPFTRPWAPPLPGHVNFGKTLFHSDQGSANCARCHKVDGDGGDVGPDLSTIARDRTPAQILESILDPHAVVTEGYQSVMVATGDGTFITGVLREESDTHIRVGDADGTIFIIQKSRIDRMSYLDMSLMPANFHQTMSLQGFYDLLAYIQTLR